MGLELGKIKSPKEARYYSFPKRDLSKSRRAVVVFAPRGISETLLAIQNFNSYYSREETNIIAVTQAPQGMDDAVKVLNSPFGSSDEVYFFDDFMMQSDVPKSVMGGGLTDGTIYINKEHMTGETVAEALRRTGYEKLVFLSNNHAGMERLVSTTAHNLPEYKIRVTSPEANEVLSSKYRTSLLQKELGFKVPPMALVCGRNDQGEIKDERTKKTEIMRQVDFIGSQTGGAVTIKADNLYGSTSYYKIPPELFPEEKEDTIVRHLEDLTEEGGTDTLVQAFRRGVNVGAFITVSGGEIHIDYTRKVMAKGKDGNRSEEVEHSYDPNDPINTLCEAILSPKIKAIMSRLKLDACDQAYNVDAILDEKYFDKNDQVIIQEPDKDDENWIVEVNDRQGGEGMNLFWSQVYKKPYDGHVLAGNLGNSSRVAEMNDWNPVDPAIMHTPWHKYHGPVLKNAYPGHTYNIKNGLFYLNSFERLAVGEGGAMMITEYMRTYREVEDYKDKGDRPVLGISAKGMPQTRRILHQAIDSLGMLGLWEGGDVYFDGEKGEYVHRRVHPNSTIGKWLKGRYGCIYEKGKWSRPE